MEKSLPDHQFAPRRLLSPVREIADSVTGESQQVEGGQHAGQMLLSMPEIMLQVVASSFQRLDYLVLDLPARPPSRDHGRDMAVIGRQV